MSSNSFLYTGYDELKGICEQDFKPKIILLTSPNHEVRNAQLFYDDVFCNATITGLKRLLERNGYEVREGWIKNWPGNEIIIMGIIKEGSQKYTKYNGLRRSADIIDIRSAKESVLKTYQKQYSQECRDRESEFTIFGTSIDSAILGSFHSGKIKFVKDLAYPGEEFAGYPVIDWKDCSEYICIPKLMNSRAKIESRIVKYKNQ